MDFKAQFDQIRPYYDPEVNDAIKRIIKYPEFKDIISFIYKGQDIDRVLSMIKKIDTVEQFQEYLSHKAVNRVVEATSNGLTVNGLKELDKTKSYLFVANHRDIVMDSAIMQAVLIEHGHRTSQITFGSNLMSQEMIVDLGKLNKMFTFYSGGSKLQAYKNALLHSAYIRHVLTKQNESIWIAQRDGRTKDGNDVTQPALIKMFVAQRKDYVKALMELNIVPVTTSYEYEPCDIQKVVENYISMNEVYTKKPGEDFQSILDGIHGKKGHIHVNFGKPINPILEELNESDEDLNLNEFANMVADEINSQVYLGYKLWPGNYIAWDMIKKKTIYLDKKYSKEDIQNFESYIEQKMDMAKVNNTKVKEMMVQMYAMPLVNYKKTIAAQKATL